MREDAESCLDSVDPREEQELKKKGGERKGRGTVDLDSDQVRCLQEMTGTIRRATFSFSQRTPGTSTMQRRTGALKSATAKWGASGSNCS